MGNERISWREEALQLPLADLKKIYERTKARRKLLTSVPFMLLLGLWIGITFFYLFGNISRMLVEGSLLKFLIAAALSISFLIWRFVIAFSTSGKNGSNMVLVISAVDLALQAGLSFVVSTPVYLFIALILPIYLILVRPYVIQADEDIAFLRAMPTFPFNARVSDQMINVAEHKRKIQLIESAKGNIYSDDAEQIFDMPVPEAPTYEKGDTPEDYLQRKHMYINGKMTKTSLTDEEYDRQDDELYERRMFTDKKKKAEGLPIESEEIPDDGRLQEFDFTDQSKLNEVYLISEDVFTEDFEHIQKSKHSAKVEDIKLDEGITAEDFDFTQREEAL